MSLELRHPSIADRIDADRRVARSRRRRSRPAILLGAVLAALLCHAPPLRAQNDLGPLSDEFEEPGSIPHWSRLHVVEQWNAEQLETWDIDATVPGRMAMVPHTVTWFQDWVGPYAFKTVSGDFALTTDATVTGRDGASVPAALFSLGGIMVRRPRAITPATWTPGGEGYVFLSVGYGNAQPPRFQFEVKTTVNSASTLFLTDAPGAACRLQVARIGSAVITLRREPAGAWVVHRRFSRPDFPESLQAGLVSYTDWGKVQYFSPFVHNQTALDPPLPPGVVDPRPDVPFAPDVLARFDYAHYFRVVVPAPLQGRDLTNPAQVSDAELLSFLGESADVPGPDLTAVGPQAGSPERILKTAPNPFRGDVGITLRLDRAGAARVDVLDPAGRRIHRLHDGPMAAGEIHLRWDGRDANGRPAAPGVYLVRACAPHTRALVRICRVE